MPSSELKDLLGLEFCRPPVTLSGLWIGREANSQDTALGEVTAPTRKSVCRPQDYFPDRDFGTIDRDSTLLQCL